MGIETFRASNSAQELLKNEEVMKKFRGRKTDLINTALEEYAKQVLNQPEKKPRVHVIERRY